MSLSNIIKSDGSVYFIGEISCNHDGNLDVVLRTIDALVRVGADAVKIQTDAIDGTGSTMDFRTPYFTVSGGTIWDGANLMDLYKEAYTPLEWHAPIFNYCRKLGIDCFSTPYSESTINFLKDFEMPAVKVASMEANDLRFVKQCASMGIPIIISTGMIDFDGARRAVKACHEVGNFDVVLLKCVSEYPAVAEDMNLSGIQRIHEELGVYPGLSDHTITHTSALVATALGARVIEKHVKLDNSIGGPDASFSLTVDQFGDMISLCREAKASVGQPVMTPKAINVSYARSIFVIKDINKGEIFSEDNVRVIRPGNGLPPNEWNRVIGATCAKSVCAGHPLLEENIDA